MQLHIELWELLTYGTGLVLAFLTFVFAAGRVLLGQIDQRLEVRFRLHEVTYQDARRHWDQKFGNLEASAGRDAEKYAQLERDLMSLKADLPEKFVRREDWIRFAAVIDAKQDALAEKFNTLNVRLERLIGEREQ